MHFEAARNRWVVRWREDGRNRSRSFGTADEAEAFDDAVRRSREIVAPAPSSPNGDGIYPYGTRAGVVFRFVFRQSDGTMSSRRGFTSRRAAADARRRIVESIERGEAKVARETFGAFWRRLLEERRPYLTAGSYADFATHGRKRLLSTFEDVPLGAVDEERVRAWFAALAAPGAGGELSAKTANNAGPASPSPSTRPRGAACFPETRARVCRRCPSIARNSTSSGSTRSTCISTPACRTTGRSHGDGTLDLTDVKDGDRVLVLARIAKGTTFVTPTESEPAETVPARKLVDKTNPPVDDAEAGA